MSRAIKEQELQSQAEKFARAVELEDPEVPASDASLGPLANLQEQFDQLQQQVHFTRPTPLVILVRGGVGANR